MIWDLNNIISRLYGRYGTKRTHTLTLTDEELCNLCWLWSAAETMKQQMVEVQPALEILQSKFAGPYYSMGDEHQRTLELAKLTLARETQAIKPHPHSLADSNWRGVLDRLRDDV